jgi:hypothetical protein
MFVENRYSLITYHENIKKHSLLFASVWEPTTAGTPAQEETPA